VWTPLQRQYLSSYVWSAVAISRSGSYELLVIVDQTTKGMALDADVVPSHQRRAATRFPSRRRAVYRGAVGLTWQRREWDHAALHAFLRQCGVSGSDLP
jgi:hypothetical protein